MHNALLRLADNLRKYASYLDEQVVITQTSHARKMACTNVNKWQLYHAMNTHPNIKPSMKHFKMQTHTKPFSLMTLSLLIGEGGTNTWPA